MVVRGFGATFVHFLSRMIGEKRGIRAAKSVLAAFCCAGAGRVRIRHPRRSRQTCESAGRLFAQERITCTGSVGSVSGSPQLGVVEAGENLDGAYRLEAILSVDRGTVRAYATSSDGERVGGKVSPGHPLRIVAAVDPVDEEEVDLALEVAGEAAGDLRYEATLVRQD